ncbi:MAG: AMP-binding protein [Myxococcota bacterium]
MAMTTQGSDFVASFEARLAADGDAVALIDRARRATWRELDALSRRHAEHLARHGVVAGERVAVMAGASIELVAALLAHLRLGVVHVPVNHRYRPDEVDYIVAHSGARLLVTDLGHLAEEPAPRSTRADGADPDAAAWRATAPEADALALIVYTSGTTGRPKGVMLSHRALAANLGAMMALWQVDARDVLSLALPLFHVHGLGLGVLGALLLAHATIRLHARFEPAAIVADFAAAEGPATVFMGVPTMYHGLLEHLGNDPSAAAVLARARLFTAGSAALSASCFERFRAATGHAILERYGMTETGFTLSNPYRGERRPGTVGLPVPGVALRLDDPDRAADPAGETGEIEVRGEGLMDGYWQDDAATRAAFRDGWFRTGDVAARDADGYFRIVGRASTDIIKSGGFKIGAREIEDVLRLDARLGEVAVLGVPDPKWGEVVVAVVAAAPGATLPSEDALLAELQALADQHLADYKQPRRVRIAAELPKNAMGKVQKTLLRALFQADARG